MRKAFGIFAFLGFMTITVAQPVVQPFALTDVKLLPCASCAICSVTQHG